MPDAASHREAVQRAVEEVQRLGADQADAYLEVHRESQLRVRDGEIEDLTQATSRGLGLRAIVENRLGFAYGSDLTRQGLKTLAERALALARTAAPDPANRLPSAAELQARNPDLQLCDPAVVELTTEWKIAAALEMERASKAVDERIRRFESIGVSDVVTESAIASSEGLCDEQRGSYVVLYSAPVAQGEAGELQVGSWADQKRFLGELATAQEVGRIAAQRAVRMLGARKVPTARVPVIFEPAMAASFFGGLLSALDGNLVLKGASFLREKLGETLAPPHLDLVDDGRWPRGLGSTAFDGEGLATRRTPLLEAGQLKTFLYDCYTAAKAGRRSSATASRGYQRLPSIGSTTVVASSSAAQPAAKILREVRRGFYVTAMLGRGLDPVTGDYSRGANGFWIENGELTRPVQEVTVAGNLLSMLKSIDAVGDDLEFHGSVGAPTLRFAELTLSGE